MLLFIFCSILIPMKKRQGDLAIIPIVPSKPSEICHLLKKVHGCFLRSCWEQLQPSQTSQPSRFHFFHRWIIQWGTCSSMACTFESISFWPACGNVFKTFFFKAMLFHSLMRLCIASFDTLTPRFFLICFVDIFCFDFNLLIFWSV